uniref:ABC transporter domain-containing protein n=1 Tax=Macrostomum lignano TaxID=282301 RepID=A0A1I8JCR7_9PLAT
MATDAANGSDYSIEVRSLWKGYSQARGSVIRDLTLQVQKGHIYGLLGPSGCGKTTLLKCIVGRLRPDSGLIRVMGQRPGKLGHKVPGSLIGYMPQDLALYQEFTISETLFYFGRIFGMDSAEIKARVDFLVNLLKLPCKDKLIYRLRNWGSSDAAQNPCPALNLHEIHVAQQLHFSGGQQRRVSFACALLHEPPLLILDEPTVGVDPLLRQ